MSLPRFRIEGHLYYVTTVVYGRLPIFRRASFVLPLLDSLNYYRYANEFKLLGYAIMPDHVHLLIWPVGAATVSDIMRNYKEFTAKRIAKQAQVEGLAEWSQAFLRAGQETGHAQSKVWQDNYWDENVYSERFLRQKLNYIHRNPVRGGLVSQPEDYPYSSYRAYVLGDETLLEVDRDWF